MDDELTITDETTMPVEMPTVKGLRRADIAFVVDCTQTMKVALKAIVETIDEVARMYHEADVKIRMALTEFRDQHWPSDKGKHKRHVLHHHEFGDSKLTEDVEEYIKALRSLEASGGGYLRESCFDAMVSTAENLDWDEGADRVIVFFSDAQPWENDQLVTGGVDEAAQRLTDGKIDQLHLVINKKDWEEDYFELLFIPSPSNPKDQIHGGSWDLFRSSRGLVGENEDMIADLDELKGILGKIARLSISGLRGSNPNNRYFDGKTKHRRKNNSKTSEEKDGTTKNRYL